MGASKGSERGTPWRSFSSWRSGTAGRSLGIGDTGVKRERKERESRDEGLRLPFFIFFVASELVCSGLPGGPRGPRRGKPRPGRQGQAAAATPERKVLRLSLAVPDVAHNPPLQLTQELREFPEAGSARADFGVKLFRFSRSPGLSVQVASAWRF